jgi:hypothetical protein
MAGYFSNFPSTPYNVFNTTNITPQVVTNILARSTFLKEILENTAIYYEYVMKENDTPESIADKLYGSPTRHWIVLLFNQIINPFYDLPLTSEALTKYIENKYNQSIPDAQTTIHHYELKVTKTLRYNGFVSSEEVNVYTVNEHEVDFSTGQITTRAVPGVADTSLDVSSNSTTISPGIVLTVDEVITAVSNYTHEITVNEEKRKIKLLDAKYIPGIELEFKKLMQNG